MLLVILFIFCAIILLVKELEDDTPTFVPYPDDMLIQIVEPYTATIFYILPGGEEITECNATIEQEGDLLPALFSQWRDLSQLPSSVSLISYEEVFGKEETLSSGGSAYLQYTPTPPDIFLEISGNINEYVPFEGCIMESLVQTIETAYGDVQTLTIVIDGRVVYEG